MRLTLDDLLANTVACPTTGCWFWCGSTSGDPKAGETGRGYGKVKWGGQSHMVHRLVYVLAGNKLRPTDQVDHKCRRRLCIRPEHLQRTTHLQNMRLRDRARRG